MFQLAFALGAVVAPIGIAAQLFSEPVITQNQGALSSPEDAGNGIAELAALLATATDAQREVRANDHHILFAGLSFAAAIGVLLWCANLLVLVTTVDRPWCARMRAS